MAGVNQWLCIGFIVSASLLLVWQTFRLNARYGTHGLMKAAARKKTPTLHYQPKGDTPAVQLQKKKGRKNMRNTLKATTLERKFPLLAVENGCIISKDADITVAFRVELPELFTVTSAEYEAIHSAWYKAIKVLPDYSIVHKQDFFIKENYQPDTERDELSFLSRSFERHFNERPFLNHYCYLFLTKTTRERSRRQSDFSTLCRGRIVPQEIADKEAATKFIEAVGQFERIMNDSGFVTLTRLAASEITGQDGKAGIIEKYFAITDRYHLPERHRTVPGRNAYRGRYTVPAHAFGRGRFARQGRDGHTV